MRYTKTKVPYLNLPILVVYVRPLCGMCRHFNGAGPGYDGMYTGGPINRLSIVVEQRGSFCRSCARTSSFLPGISHHVDDDTAAPPCRQGKGQRLLFRSNKSGEYLFRRRNKNPTRGAEFSSLPMHTRFVHARMYVGWAGAGECSSTASAYIPYACA